MFYIREIDVKGIFHVRFRVEHKFSIRDFSQMPKNECLFSLYDIATNEVYTKYSESDIFG